MSQGFDVIVVMGAGVWEGRTASPAMRQRVEHAVALYEAGRAPQVLMTGGLGKHPPAEAILMKELAVEMGIPEEAVHIEPESETTLESALLCAKMMHAAGWARALVVSHRYHLLRSCASFVTFGITARGSSCNVRSHWRLSRLHVREGLACAFYALRLPIARLRHGGELR